LQLGTHNLCFESNMHMDDIGLDYSNYAIPSNRTQITTILKSDMRHGMQLVPEISKR
jgi:hypothetical protein